jgi:hypothetical protein
MLLYVEDMKRYDHFGSSLLTVRDISGATMQAIMSESDAAHVSLALKGISVRTGSIIYLQNVSILVQKTPFVRFLVFHRQSFRFILPSLSSL